MLNTYHQQAKKRLIATVVSLILVAGIVVYIDHISATDSSSNVASTTTTSAGAPSSSSSTSTDTSGSASGTSNTDSTASGSTSTTPASGSSSSTSSSVGIKDGTYTASSDYYVPHGNESIQVNLTVKNGAVADVSVQNSDNDRESTQFQQDFTAGYKQYVIGKPLSGLKIGIIAGASDTTDGFNNAVAQIQTKAQA